MEQLRAGEVTFARAAELAEMTVWDFTELVRERDITWVGGDGVDADFEAL